MVDDLLERIAERNHETNAYVLVLAEDARRRARAAERALMSGGELGPLHGVPVAIKDLFDFKAGVRNTFGSKPLADFVPKETCAYVERLEQAGAIVLGKTNTPEFGHKATTDNLLFGPTSTPFDLARNAGGSSGGSAAAVAAGLAPLAQGSDAGGSIRVPASFCGLYGFKASFGRVAAPVRPNAFLLHTPFVHAGPLARSVDDAALMLAVMAGPHPRDPFSLPRDRADDVPAPRGGVAGMKIAYSPNFDLFPVQREVATVVDDAVAALAAAGATVDQVQLGLERSQEELSALWLRQVGVLYAEVAESFKLAGIDLAGAHGPDLAPEFARMIELGRSQSALQYKLDDWIRTEVFDALQDVFDRYDLLVTPTVAVPSVQNAAGGNTLGPGEVDGEAVDRCIGWCLTYPINFTGNPAASVPAGLTAGGMPVGMQLVGRRHADASVLAASAAFEQIRPWHDTYLDLERKRNARAPDSR
ncbi:MAG: amidase [Pirellulales bacterium]